MTRDRIKLPSQDLLQQLLSYDPDSGVLTWKPRTPDMWPETTCGAKKLCEHWNAAYAGKPALNTLTSGGYRFGTLLGLRCKRHRVIWKLQTDQEPEDIDHINGVPGDDRWKNLRNVSHQSNQKNLKLNKQNSTGVTGVSWDRTNRKWRASINCNGTVKNLGRYVRMKDAVLARKQAEREHGYHKNHGKRRASS